MAGRRFSITQSGCIEMVKKSFRIEVEPINEHITTEGLESKLRLIMGGVGLRSLSLSEIDNHEDQDQSIKARLTSWIEQQGGQATTRDVQRAFGFLTTDDAVRALQGLVDDGRGEWVESMTMEPGRTVKTIRSNTHE